MPEFLASTPSESLSYFAGILYLGLSMLMILAANTVYSYHQKVTLLRREKGFMGTVWLLLAVQVTLTLVAIVLDQQGLIPEESFVVAMAQWIMTITALVCLMAFWRFRHADFVHRKSNNRESKGFPIILGILCGVLFLVFSISMQLLWPTEVTATNDYTELMENPWAMLIFCTVALMAPLIEEIIFRLGLQTMFEHLCRMAGISIFNAVGLTALLFAFVHSGSVDPFGFKETQIFVIGLVLGYLKIRYGFWSAVAAHMTLNTLIIGSTFLGV